MNDDLLALLNKAYFFLKFRPRSEKEVRDYLYKKIKSKHWSRDDAEKVIGELRKEDLIDDEKFVAWFVRSRTTLKPKGERLLKRELKQKGVSDELIEKYFSENIIDEESLAFKILEKRWLRFKNLDSRKRFEKSTRFLMSRGFSFDLCKSAFEKLENKD
ncbi:MAG: Regulatory protein RecX [Candidatus Roizmanbacteria bacterium GW2011_GWC2_37_13]|uniref:Regulatory protein RecX n=1 Tax=Candidatus Roizmanbacteria bacterium GW2011_GWC2_37_13 TaxID=1618486 RepID=A0A0G0G869_9BACT|nr:MAG: Regulatory protein RecX [Candidatus Roizmanbacteria bacterium GW2011_GWC1_37_12]KKQ26182.1 MAG: Regulatory protein RecX [Candidatus Roizmanbacteria bacterium GW2011_GWC2_37_13]